jgi:hypothetical protein
MLPEKEDQLARKRRKCAHDTECSQARTMDRQILICGDRDNDAIHVDGDNS